MTGVQTCALPICSDLGQWDAALATLQCAELSTATQEPWASRIRYAYADVLANMGRNDEALKDYTFALQRNPKLASALMGRGIAKLRAGDMAGRTDIEEAERTKPGTTARFAKFGLMP